MLEEPKNYEEARRIIENAVDDDLQTKMMKRCKLRIIIVYGVLIAAAVIAGVKTGDTTLGIIAFLNALILGSPFTIPFFKRRSVTKMIHDGSYFEKVDEDKMMHAAIDYVREYNEYEEKKR